MEAIRKLYELTGDIRYKTLWEEVCNRFEDIADRLVEYNILLHRNNLQHDVFDDKYIGVFTEMLVEDIEIKEGKARRYWNLMSEEERLALMYLVEVTVEQSVVPEDDKLIVSELSYDMLKYVPVYGKPLMFLLDACIDDFNINKREIMNLIEDLAFYRALRRVEHPQRFRDWVSAFPDPNERQQWYDLYKSIWDKYKGKGLSGWKKAKFNPDSAMGIAPNSARSFKDTGFTPDSARPWLELCAEVVQMCVSADVAKEWLEVYFGKSPQYVLSPSEKDEVREWLEVAYEAKWTGFTPEYARELKDNKLTPKKAGPLLAGWGEIFDIYHALKHTLVRSHVKFVTDWIEKGCSPEDVKPWALLDVRGPDFPESFALLFRAFRENCRELNNFIDKYRVDRRKLLELVAEAPDLILKIIQLIKDGVKVDDMLKKIRQQPALRLDPVGFEQVMKATGGHQAVKPAKKK
jgi:hypothetical protein